MYRTSFKRAIRRRGTVKCFARWRHDTRPLAADARERRPGQLFGTCSDSQSVTAYGCAKHRALVDVNAYDHPDGWITQEDLPTSCPRQMPLSSRVSTSTGTTAAGCRFNRGRDSRRHPPWQIRGRRPSMKDCTWGPAKPNIAHTNPIIRVAPTSFDLDEASPSHS